MILGYAEKLAKAVFGLTFGQLSKLEQKVLDSNANRRPVSENINETFHENLTLGQRVADKVAAFGGSWTFIILFLLVMLGWMFINTWLLIGEEIFDPYPYVLLNLVLSSLAALQAPIIMMSQNRQAAKDRLEIAADYQVNLKSELEIMRLHEKMDEVLKLLGKKTEDDI